MSVYSFGRTRLRGGFFPALSLAIVTGATALAQTTAPPQTAGQSPTAAQPQAQGAQPAASAQPQAPALTLNSGAGVLFHQIKSDRAEDFDWVMTRMKEAMLKSTDPVVKQQAAGMQVFKSTDPGQNGNVTYVMLVNPAVKDADYSMQSMLKLLYAAFPEQQQEIYKRVSGAFGGPTSRVNLQLVADYSK